jgi:hypothetical protein
MIEISKKSLKMLKKINKLGYLPENEIPTNFDRVRLKFLVEKELLTVITLIPVGQEGFEHGLVAYTLSPEGEDAIYKHHKVEREARIALILSVIATLISLYSAFSY